MKRLRPAACLGAFAMLALAAPAPAQVGGGSANRIGTMRTTVVPAPQQSYVPGNFPIPGFNRWSDRPDRRERIIRDNFVEADQPDDPDRPDEPDRPQDCERFRDCDDYFYYGGGIGYGGYVNPDRGYFASRGQPYRTRNGGVAYDYDRGYPYDHYREPRAREMAHRGSRERHSNCEMEWTRNLRSGERVPVRICRN